ncbi:multiple epidermal growth factor-like domains protein 10 [Haliotis rubra]|uniref:multiple epidermal growth factor-like domains protein 10 n=1 Tax=Haliotis rubra TaxID=36100 RepID=UPI001EE57A5B|nr:multiple epidermal growth factor-like domains protein 10 [Haliotis rubra]
MYGRNTHFVVRVFIFPNTSSPMTKRGKMFTLTILSLACIFSHTQASHCTEDQHCSDCDITTGFCTSDCLLGFYDQKCRSKCNKNCLGKACSLSSNGNDNCTNGCVSGYQGTGCNIPCDSTGGSCTACPGGCDGGYCQLGSSCVSGCVDSYYGAGCKNCSSGCKQCNRITGTCIETNPASGCEGGCVPGHTDSGCKHGDCVHGSRHPDVKPPDTGCKPGLYGDHCNKSCRVCGDGDCDQMSGFCFRGCNKTGRGCRSSCRLNCTLAECTIETCPEGDQEVSDDRDLNQSINMGLLTVLCLFVFCILITVCVCYCRITFSQRAGAVQEEVEYRDEPARERLASMYIRSHHTYCDVDESGTGPVIIFL